MTDPTSAPALRRRRLNARQAVTVEALLDAARRLLDQQGYDELTIRRVAREAGVSAATAYTYFSSKEHLFASVFARHMSSAPPPRLSGRATARTQQTVRHLADLVAASPALAAAATKSLLGSDADVADVRVALGREWAGLFATALGEDADPALVRALLFMFDGALLEAGMGLLDHDELADQLASTVAAVLSGRP